ncbi:hypothetical protein MPDQ_004452 [Monascus purpureus]|uniref:Rhodopsin domain-containing protein n=1 Tax=Monascus purpureus TaxID=5098 RepID=A0A507QXL9_MONPU|nr:hypothetical protein MPDQ_004452 [Monascus purpureus]
MSSSSHTGDHNGGTGIIIACWVLTGIVSSVLLLRYIIKIWVRCKLPRFGSLERVWGIEDVLYICGFALDMAHMACIQKSYDWGLGRHEKFLSTAQRTNAIKYQFISQPLAIAAALFSRTGMMWFVFTCLNNDRRVKWTVFPCMAIQIIINLIALFQIVAQCGPDGSSDRINYFHYMWDPLPTDGSIKCHPPSVQMNIEYVQGAVNTAVDFLVTLLTAVELWYSLLQTMDRGVRHKSIYSNIRDMNPAARSRRIWQTVTLSGPLFFSGIACIVKTCLTKDLGRRQDFTYKILDFVLWTKLENYCILLGSAAAVARLFLLFFTDHHRAGTAHKNTGFAGETQTIRNQGRLDLYPGGHRLSQSSSQETAVEMVTEDWNWVDIEGKRNRPAPPIWMEEPKELDINNAVTIQTDIVVEVESEVAEGSSSRGAHDDSSTQNLV